VGNAGPTAELQAFLKDQLSKVKRLSEKANMEKEQQKSRRLEQFPEILRKVQWSGNCSSITVVKRAKKMYHPRKEGDKRWKQRKCEES